MLKGIFNTSPNERYTILRRAGAIAILILTASLCNAQKQEFHRWILQDSSFNQEIARKVIRKVNKQLYNVNPDAQLQREDETVSIVIAVSHSGMNATWSRSLLQVQVGPVIQEDSLSAIFGPDLVQQLLQRDYYWKDILIPDPSVIRVSEAVQPLEEIQSFKSLKDIIWWSPSEYSISLTYGFARFSDRAGLFFEFGQNEIGYPMWNSGTFRIGIVHQFIKGWIQSPLLGNNVRTFFVSRKLDGAFGAGASFDIGSAGGELSYADLTHPDNLSFVDSGKVNFVSSIAQVYYILPLTIKTFFPGVMRIKFGGGIHQVISGTYDSTTNGAIQKVNRGVYRGGPYLKAEFASSAQNDGIPAFVGSFQYYNGDVMIYSAYNFSSWFAMEAQLSYVFSPDPWEQQLMWTISPRLSF
ncbi:MAG TPA: hypothetical protein VFA55_06570 [Candidatus Kapabacteria bacterium]|nr:hypothetical protein [Candidatus Kapabacteria bacterium]